MFGFPFRDPIFMAPDAGGAAAESAADQAHEETGGNEAGGAQGEAQLRLGADAQEEAAAAQPPETQDAADTAQEDAPKEETPDLAGKLSEMTALALSAQLRSAAALAGVPAARIPYVMRMADTAGIDPLAKDAPDKLAEAVGKVLSDVPELRGSTGGTGSIGNFARKTGEAEDPDMARIRKNILG